MKELIHPYYKRTMKPVLRVQLNSHPARRGVQVESMGLINHLGRNQEPGRMILERTLTISNKGREMGQNKVAYKIWGILQDRITELIS